MRFVVVLPNGKIDTSRFWEHVNVRIVMGKYFEGSHAFKDREDKSFDIICAELCGWGHYKMSGRVRALPDAEYAEWVAKQVALKNNND